MSATFQSLPIKKLVWETPEALSIHFEKPRTADFHYLPGQYLTLRVRINDKEERRAYSLCSSPFTDDNLVVTVKRVNDGRVSNYLAENLKEGESLEVLPPMGKFTIETKPSHEKHYIMLGGGSGITPLMSMIKAVLQMEPGSLITLIYCNINQDSIIFKDTLNELAKKFDGRLRIHHYLADPKDGWTGKTGMLNKQIMLDLFQALISADQRPASFYLCGPAGLMDEAQKALAFIGVSKDDIHRELFTAPLPKLDEQRTTTSAVKGEHQPAKGTYNVEVVLDGKNYTITVPEDKTLLEVAIDEGLDPPYACQMGICTTCRAKCHSGVIEMEETEGLSDGEIEDGFVLTCQSHPMTPDVKVEFG